jgi:thiol:disulfide interchange protein DsbC
MVGGTQPPRSMGECDAGAIQRNVAMAQKYKLNSTPSLVFEDGKRMPGAVSPVDIEKSLVAATAAKKG